MVENEAETDVSDDLSVILGPETVVSGQELASVIGLSIRRVYEHGNKGNLVRSGTGYALKASVRRYCAELRSQITKTGAASTALTDARVLKEQAAAQKLELQNAKLAGNLIPADEVAAAWGDTCVTVRARILAVPARVRAALPGLTPSQVEIITAELTEALQDLANEA